MPDGLTTVGDRVRAQAAGAGGVPRQLRAGPSDRDPRRASRRHRRLQRVRANDGYVDVMNVVAGTPPPDNQTVVPGDGVDLVNPDLVNLVNTRRAGGALLGDRRWQRQQPRSHARQRRPRHRDHRAAHRASAHRRRLPRDTRWRRRDGVAVLRPRSGRRVLRDGCAEPRRTGGHKRRGAESGRRRPEPRLTRSQSPTTVRTRRRRWC